MFSATVGCAKFNCWIITMKPAQSVLYVRTDIYAQPLVAGGSVSHTIGVIDGFNKCGYRILVASSCMENYFKTADIAAFVHLQNPRIFRLLRTFLNCLISNIFFSYQLIKLLKKEKVDFIYQRYSMLNCTGVLLNKIKKIPFVLEYNGSETWVQKNWATRKKIKMLWLIDLFERINIKNATFIIVVSQALKDELCVRGINAQKILVNPNGVDPITFDSKQLEKERIEIRTQNAIAESDFVVGFVGTFNKWHGIELLSEIIPDSLQKNKSLFFLMIGDGPLFGLFKKKLTDQRVDSHRVMLTGLISHKQARNYLSACDAFICPTQSNTDGSAFFGSPTKLFEYMSLEKPVIASDIGQLAEILKPECGILVPSADAGRFVDAITHLATKDVFEKKRMGKCARDEIINNYSWQQHVARISAFVKGEQ